ncbi:hypothetical protein AX16_005174 [Volvariella volvacea WC 439]|nr:hypothetical protein AX16_005174 [Volvariella volvacea WC 439]
MQGDYADRQHLLSHQPSDSGFSYKSGSSYGYYENQYATPPTPTVYSIPNPYKAYTHRNRRRICGPGCYWPALVIFGQLLFLAGAWGFYITAAIMPLPLPNSMAVMARNNPHTITYLVTAVGSCISILTGFLYSHSIRYALMMALSRPVSLYVVSSSISLAAQAPILNVKRWKWTIVGLVCALALGLQTAGWTTLLTPHTIWMKTKLAGIELNMNDEAFQRTVSNLNAQNLPDTLNNIFPIILDSGAVALGAKFGLPAALNWNHFSFVDSTGGIMPPFFTETKSIVSSNTTLPINARVGAYFRNPPGFLTNYTAVQQGVTANITCRKQQLDATTIPAVQVRTDWVTRLSADPTIELSNISLARTWMEIDCGHPRNTTLLPFFTNWDSSRPEPNNAIYVGACISPEGIYDYVFKGTGVYTYLGTTICTVEPQVTQVLVQYLDHDTDDSKARLVSILDVVHRQASATSGYAPSLALQRAFSFWQGIASNLMGDALTSFYVGREDEDNIVPRLMEPFLTGVFEFGSTLFRIGLSERPNPFLPDGVSQITESSYITYEGTYSTETIGWAQLPHGIPLILFAPTFVTAVSVIIVIYTLFKAPGHTGDEEAYSFDPYDTLHVVGATARGDLTIMQFPDFDEGEQYLSTSEAVMVTLKRAEGRPLGFRHR